MKRKYIIFNAITIFFTLNVIPVFGTLSANIITLNPDFTDDVSNWSAGWGSIAWTSSGKNGGGLEGTSFDDGGGHVFDTSPTETVSTSTLYYYRYFAKGSITGSIECYVVLGGSISSTIIISAASFTEVSGSLTSGGSLTKIHLACDPNEFWYDQYTVIIDDVEIDTNPLIEFEGFLPLIFLLILTGVIVKKKRKI
ncbi:MAG: hypothetical protein ACXAC7_20335 [Candidatus Hodarchaeales archaeon]|jgi:hypothetical protein